MHNKPAFRSMLEILENLLSMRVALFGVNLVGKDMWMWKLEEISGEKLSTTSFLSHQTILCWSHIPK